MGGGSVAKAPLPRTFHSTDEFLRTTPNWLNHKESFGFYDSDTRFELKQWLERHHQESKEITKIGVPPKALKASGLPQQIPTRNGVVPLNFLRPKDAPTLYFLESKLPWRPPTHQLKSFRTGLA